MPLRLFVFHVVVATALKKIHVLDLNTEGKVIETSGKDKLKCTTFWDMKNRGKDVLTENFAKTGSFMTEEI